MRIEIANLMKVTCNETTPLKKDLIVWLRLTSFLQKGMLVLRLSNDTGEHFAEMTQDGVNQSNIPIKEKTCITQAFNTSICWQILGEAVAMMKGG